MKRQRGAEAIQTGVYKIREGYGVGKEVRPFQGNWKHDTETDILLGAGSGPRASGNVLTLNTHSFPKACIFSIKDN